MTATEVGVQLNLLPNSTTNPPAVPVSLLGSTCTMAVEGVYGTVACLPCQVSTDGTYAFRITQATDFPVGGTYQIQLVATYTNGTILKSAWIQLVVGPNLGC